MDNDNKIKGPGKNSGQNAEQRHKEVLLFLNDELNRLQTVNTRNSYDLESEYQKTKKNKSPFVFLLLFISFLVVILVAWGITARINKQNEQITVNLQEFDGLNIKSLLDSVSKVQANYDTAMKNKMNIISDRDIALKKAEEKRDSNLFLIDSLSLEKSEVAARKKVVLEEYENDVALVNQAYEPQLVIAENELAEYKKQLDEYDASKLEAARKQEQALDSERRVHQLEMDKLAKEYEARIAGIQDSVESERKNNAEQIRNSVSEVSQKYIAEIALLDPNLNADKMKTLVDLLVVSNPDAFDAAAFLEEYDIDDEEIINGMNQFQSEYDQYKAVREPMEKIPYKKSMPSYLKASESLVNNMGRTFQNTTLKFLDEKQEYEDEIDDLYDEIDDLNDEIYGLNQDIEGLNEEINGFDQRIQEIIDQTEVEKEKIRSDFEEQKGALQREYAGVYDGILTSAKAVAVVISAHSKEEILIYVKPENREHITENGVGAEIKASKSVKGMIKPVEEEPGFYLFGNALDKNGNPVDFDFDLIAPGQIVKVSAK